MVSPNCHGTECFRERIVAKQSLIREFMLFVKEEKKFWMIPLIIVLLVVGALLVFSASSPLAPFLYPLF